MYVVKKGNKGLLYATVSINEMVLTALVDTGASSTLISDMIAKYLKLQLREAAPVTGTTGKSKRGKRCYVSVKIAGKLTKCHVDVISFAHLEKWCKENKMPRYDVIIGMRELMRLRLGQQIGAALDRSDSLVF